jgi:hypothetical protein
LTNLTNPSVFKQQLSNSFSSFNLIIKFIGSLKEPSPLEFWNLFHHDVVFDISSQKNPEIFAIGQICIRKGSEGSFLHLSFRQEEPSEDVLTFFKKDFTRYSDLIDFSGISHESTLFILSCFDIRTDISRVYILPSLTLACYSALLINWNSSNPLNSIFRSRCIPSLFSSLPLITEPFTDLEKECICHLSLFFKINTTDKSVKID